MGGQKGFAHTILIVGLTVALVGAIGFMYWQNFIYKAPATGTDDSLVAQEQDGNDDKTAPETETEETQKPSKGTYHKGDSSKEYFSGDNSITISNITLKKTFPKSASESVYVYFTIKNATALDHEYTYSDFALVDSQGEVHEADIDRGTGEFGGKKLAPGGTTSGFTMFQTNSTSGTFRWMPQQGSPVEVTYDLR